MLRREVIKMTGRLFGLGAGTPSRFPYADRPQPSPGLGPSNAQTFRQVIVKGVNGGVFVYDAATGALIGSISNAAKDPVKGTTVLPVIAAYSIQNGSYVQLLPGTAGSGQASLNIGTGDAAEASPGKVIGLIQGAGPTRAVSTALTAPRVAGQAVGSGASLLLQSASPDLTIPPFAILSASDGATTGTLAATPSGISVQNGPLTATAGTAANPTLITTDGWNSLGTLAGYTVTAGRYRLTTWGAYELDINVTSLGANAANTTFSVALPAGYSGGSSTAYPLTANYTLTAGASYPRLIVTSAGAVTVAQTASKSGLITGQAFVPAT